jgi:glutamyl-tRNA synthetase
MVEIRVRFPPSPTGWMHLGNARTALFNFLFARKHQGVFILRIEDTDSERCRPEYEADIIENLLWLNLNFDEGPIRQSERISLYQKVIEQLLDENKAYRCFCSKEELAEQRQEQLVRGQTPRYSGTCSRLDPKVIAERLSRRLPYVIRLRVPEQTIIVHDLVLGDSKWDMSLIGDFVIAKSETEPLYHLATPVDDHYQGITHIIRGAEHLPNTPKQILIYQIMGWKLPLFAHLPLILGSNGKLSKRQGAKSLREYREAGYLPEAIVNTIALLGWHPRDNREVLSLPELISEFDLTAVQKKGAIFNPKKLDWLNHHYLRKKDPSELLPMLKSDAYFKATATGYQAANGLVYNQAQLYKIIELGKERAIRVNEILNTVTFFFIDFDYPSQLLIWKNYQPAAIRASLEQTKIALQQIPENQFVGEVIKTKLDQLSQDKGYIYWPLRVALSGSEFSPPPFEIAEIIGLTKTVELIDKALAKLQ